MSNDSYRPSSIALPEHSDDDRPSDSIFFKIDQALAEGSRCRARPELADPAGTVKVRQHQYVE